MITESSCRAARTEGARDPRDARYAQSTSRRCAAGAFRVRKGLHALGLHGVRKERGNNDVGGVEESGKVEGGKCWRMAVRVGRGRVQVGV